VTRPISAPRAPVASAPRCRSCLWWDTDARRVSISAPCVLTHAITRPRDTCDQHAPHRGPHALDPLCWRLSQ